MPEALWHILNLTVLFLVIIVAYWLVEYMRGRSPFRADSPLGAGTMFPPSQSASVDESQVLLQDVPEDATVRPLIELTAKEASLVGDDFFGTSHLLLVLAAHTPAGQGIDGLDLTWLRASVYGRAAMRQPERASQLPRAMTPRLKAALGRAVDRAQTRGRPLDCQDLWHGLLTDPDSECSVILEQLGFRVDAVLTDVSTGRPTGIALPPGIRPGKI